MGRRFSFRVGNSYDNRSVSVLTVRDKGLGAVQDPVVAVPLGVGPDALEIGTSARFSHGDGANVFTHGHLGQVVSFLLWGTEVGNIGHDDVAVESEAGSGAVGVGLLLPDDGGVEDVGADAAVLVRSLTTKKAVFTGVFPDFPGDDAGLFPFRVLGLDHVVEPFPGHVAEGVVVLVGHAARVGRLETDVFLEATVGGG